MISARDDCCKPEAEQKLNEEKRNTPGGDGWGSALLGARALVTDSAGGVAVMEKGSTLK